MSYVQTIKPMRWWVKVTGGPSLGQLSLVYHRDTMTFDFFKKWRWYFEYRQALYKIQNPRHITEITWGSYESKTANEEINEKLKNAITGAKAQITKWENLVDQAKKNWNELFPIEDDAMYIKAIQKIDNAKCKLQSLIKEQETFNNL